MFAWRFAAIALVVGLAGLSLAADDKKPAESKAPDFTGWLKYGNPVVGEVVKCEDKAVTLKILTRVYQRKPQYADSQFMMHDNGLVRWKKLPPKMDDKGKRIPYTPEEMTELKSPRGVLGYAADFADLKPGYMLELTLVRPKEIPLSKVVPQDLRVQYAIILTEDRNASAGGKKDDEKKPDDKKKDSKKKDEKKDKKADDKKKD